MNSAMSPPWSLGPLSLVRFGPSDLHLDVQAAHADAVAGTTCSGPRRAHRPAPDVELRSVRGERHRLPLDRALGQGTAPVGARIVDRVIGAPDVEEGDLLPSGLHQLRLPGKHLGSRCYLRELRHDLTS